MEWEGDIVWEVGDVDLLERLPVQQHHIGMLPEPVKHDRDQNPVILRLTLGVGDEEHLPRVVALLEPLDSGNATKSAFILFSGY